MQRMCIEASSKGGLLPLRDLEWLFNCGQRTLWRDLDTWATSGDCVAASRPPSRTWAVRFHRSLIIEHWLKGKSIRNRCDTHHSVPSVQNYVSSYKRVVALAEEVY